MTCVGVSLTEYIYNRMYLYMLERIFSTCKEEIQYIFITCVGVSITECNYIRWSASSLNVKMRYNIYVMSRVVVHLLYV